MFNTQQMATEATHTGFVLTYEVLLKQWFYTLFGHLV